MRKLIEPLMKDLNVIFFLFRLAHQISKTYLPIVITSSIVTALMPFLNLVMMKLVIDELTGSRRIEVFIWLVGIVVLGNLVLNVTSRCLKTKVEIKNEELLNGFDAMVGEKIMSLDFQMIEDPKILDLKERALFPIHNQGAMYRVMEYSITLFSTILTMIGLIAMISMLNPLMILFLFLMAILSAFINKKAQQVMFKFYQLLIPVNRKFSYFGNLTSDFSYGKEIRLYKMDDLIMDRIEDYNHTTLTVFTDLYEVLGRYAAYSEVMMQIQIVFVYLYMVYKVVVKSIGLGDFTMYASAATQFGQCLSQILNTYMELSQMCRYMESYIEFDALKPSVLSGKETDVPMDNLTLEFKNVSFKYPKSEVNVLNNVNVTILPGEKLSIVGLNGAAKTTFIKLLTRLYEPTEGAIYLNGVNILEYDLKEYLALMSVVFQDFKLFAFSVKDNIVFNQVEKDETIIEVLREAGFEKDLANLPKGIETPIYKTFEEDGVEFSGGQSQKIAISRAIYKNSPIVILDEPTSALDPMTEYDIYHRFNELVGAKTTIYISHRLSSCLFCDRIAVFKDGQIVELGTHDDLMKEGGLYQEMYQAQAQYYI